MVDDVVDSRGQRVDVLAVQRCYILGVQELDQVMGEPVALGLELLDTVMRDCRVGELTETLLGRASGLQRVQAGLFEQVVKLVRARYQRQSHCVSRSFAVRA